MRDVLSLYCIRISILKFLLCAFLCFWSISFFRLCHAEEQLFLDGDSRYPLIFAMENYRHYLDLDSCTIISDDEDGFEIAAEYIESKSYNRQKVARRFRKNEESDGELQVLDDYGEEWQTFYNPYDEEIIKQMLDDKGLVNFHLPDYYMFKCAYQHLFGEPYEDDWDDEELRRTAVILPFPPSDVPDDLMKMRHRFLWDDENYPRIWAHGVDAWYLDKSSVHVEMEEPPQYILRVFIMRTPQFHYNDILPSRILSCRFLYDEDEEKMYIGSRTQEDDWRYMPPDGDNAKSGLSMWVGEAAFYLAYGERFYGASQKWHHGLNKYFDVFNDAFYAHLDGEA